MSSHIDYVSETELVLEFERQRIWERIRSRELIPEVVGDKPAKDSRWRRGRSRMIKFLDLRGHHVATIHRVYDLGG